ncbi:MAG: hypothetical protein IJF83_11580 [Methanobrevibacter sp.]|nr:hypothetical protein [Methanobrevibacter sp.]
MFNKRYIFVLVLLIVAISALSAVSATDLNTTDEVIADEVSVDGQLEQTDDVSLETGKANTFKQLNQAISNVPNGGSITFYNNYSYVCPDDEDYEGGILITKNMTINGNGITINGNGARVFVIEENAHVTIKDILFVNNGEDNWAWGGTIFNSGYLTLDACEFRNSSAYKGGGVIFSNNILVLDYCWFSDNQVPDSDDYDTAGGAIYSDGLLYILGKTFFVRNYAEFGGAVMNMKLAGIYDSYFFYNAAKNDGGAVYNFEGSEENNYQDEGQCVIHSSHFETNAVLNAGGALYNCIANLTTFNDNYAKYGNNMYWGYAFDCSLLTDDNDYYDVGLFFNVKVKALKSSIVYGEKLGVKVTDINNNPIPGLTVKVKIKTSSGYKTFTGKTNAKGIAYIEITAPPKTYSGVTVTSDRDRTILDGKTTVKLTVKKDTPKITASSKSFKVKATKKLTITVKGSTGSVVKNTNVKIKVNGQTYSAKTNSKGQATFTLSKLNRKGSFTSTITLASNSNYNKATKTIKITVK